jgi:5'-nucleotidase
MSNPRILISNDDGIYAPGLEVLERIAHKLSRNVWVVAPETEQSGVAHSLTLHLPVRTRKVSPKRYAVSGTPTDCVLLAVKELIPPRERPDLILSGINNSSNVGDDITYSGTVAAAMEGTNLEVPSIALSQHSGSHTKIHWRTAEHYAPGLIKKLVSTGWPKNTLININFPDCPPNKVKGVRFCSQGKRLVNVALSGRVDPKGRPYYWLGGERENTPDKPGVDIDFLEEDYITVTPLGMDLTDYKTLKRLQQGSR